MPIEGAFEKPPGFEILEKPKPPLFEKPPGFD
jgi:hypothetical protein